eukprot:TRINITY_DN2433_c8_g1_i1.p1 TRINITY_DN2433_c8_g1~~TRINITY_DN2433_c8_g1_i1.p1  ORF type:complete len:420 (+),score=156.71 TRINITY_DN2433_c8_g1_i1:71-1261(+)
MPAPAYSDCGASGVGGDAFYSMPGSRGVSPLSATAGDELTASEASAPRCGSRLQLARQRRRESRSTFSHWNRPVELEAAAREASPRPRPVTPSARSAAAGSASSMAKEASVRKCALVTQLRTLDDRLLSLNRTILQHDAAIRDLTASVAARRSEMRQLRSEVAGGRAAAAAGGRAPVADVGRARSVRVATEERAAAAERQAADVEQRLACELSRHRSAVTPADALRADIQTRCSSRLEMQAQAMRSRAAKTQGDLEGQFTEERVRLESRIEWLEKALLRRTAECEGLQQRRGDLMNQLAKTKEEHTGLQRRCAEHFEDERRRVLARERATDKIERDIRMRNADIVSLRQRVSKLQGRAQGAAAAAATPARRVQQRHQLTSARAGSRAAAVAGDRHV